MAVPIGYRRFAGSAADFLVAGPNGPTQPLEVGDLLTLAQATITVWQGASGPRVTDLLNESESPVTSLTVSSTFSFYAPDAFGTLTVSADNGVNRVVVQPYDVADQLVSLRADTATAKIVAAQLIDPATGLVRPEMLPAGTGTGGGGTTSGPTTTQFNALTARVAALESIVTSLSQGSVTALVWNAATAKYEAKATQFMLSGHDPAASAPPAPTGGAYGVWIEAP